MSILDPNVLVYNRYRIEKLIGQGGMGAVYQARDQHLNRTVALKQMLTTSEHLSRAFRREAQLLAGLKHPALPKVTDFFAEDAGQFLVMNFIPGPDLAMLLDQQGAPFPVARVLRWADRLLDVLHYLHSQKPEPIIHRDIKPHNLKLTSTDEILLLDFGLAKGSLELMTRIGDSVPGYTRCFAPLEQQLDELVTDARSDLYTLGATLHNLLTYHPQTRRYPVDALTRLRNERRGLPDPLRPVHELNPEVPEAVSVVLMQALAVEAEQRWASALAMRVALHYAAGRQASAEQAWEAAVAHLEQMVALDATYRDGVVRLDEARRQLALAELYAQARQQYEAQNWHGVEQVFERIWAQAPSYPDPEGLLAAAQAATAAQVRERELEALYQRAVAQQAAGVWGEARKHFEELERQAPGYRDVAARLEQLVAPPARTETGATQKESALRPSQQNATKVENQAATFTEPAPRKGGRAETLPLPIPRQPTQSSPLRTPWLLMMGGLALVVALAVIYVARPPEEPLTPIDPTIPAQPSAVSASDPASDNPLVLTLTGHITEVESVTFAPDGQTLASASDDTTVKLWRVSDGSELRMLAGHTGDVESVAFAPDGQTLASGAWDAVKLWRVDDGTELRTFEGHTDPVTSVTFAPDGQTLASGSWDNTVKLWRVSDGSLLHTLTGHQDWVQSVAFARDGQTLASASDDTTVKLWRVSDGSLLHTLTGHTGNVESVAFAPDGQTLASGSLDRTVKLWRVDDGTELRTFEGHTDPVTSVTFAPDGQTLASGSWDNTVKLWRVSDGSLLHTLTGHQDWVQSVAFAPDGQTLASGSLDRTVKLWRVGDLR